MTPAIATIVNPFAPVTPPPDSQTFGQKAVPLQPPVNPPLQPSFHGMGWGFDLPFPPLATMGAQDSTTQQHQQRLSQSLLQKLEEAEPPKRDPSAMQPPPRPATSAVPTSTASQQPQAPTETQTHPQPPMQAPGPLPAHMDPRDLATAARITAFYQQQRCQAWARAYRKRCHEAMQAATFVVAWYVRDRIRRRRRRQKDRFRRGLRERRAAVRPVGRGEAVRRWVKGVPREVLPPNTVPMDKAADKEEGGFSMNGEAPLDREAELFEMADGLIKSRYRDVEVPLMGVLSFDESDSDSEESEGLCARCKVRSSAVDIAADLPGQECDGEDDDYEDYDEEELYEDEEDMDEPDEALGSELAHGGGTGQRNQDTEGVLPLL